ncbi:MAG: hypothetical protein ACRDL7_04905 [Gaiellaceae bacterium]
MALSRPGGGACTKPARSLHQARAEPAPSPRGACAEPARSLHRARAEAFRRPPRAGVPALHRPRLPHLVCVFHADRG